MLIIVHKLEKGLRVYELADLAKLAPHGIEHAFGQQLLPVVLVDVRRIQRNPLASLVGGDVGGTVSFSRTVFWASTGFLL